MVLHRPNRHRTDDLGHEREHLKLLRQSRRHVPTTSSVVLAWVRSAGFESRRSPPHATKSARRLTAYRQGAGNGPNGAMMKADSCFLKSLIAGCKLRVGAGLGYCAPR